MIAGMGYEMITGLILAGGRGSRMGEVDKGLQVFSGRPMIEHVIERLRPQVADLVINANRNLEIYESYSFPVYSDAISGFAGPLAGMHAGLQACKTSFMATAPCDSPFLPRDLIARLHARLIEASADLAVAATGCGESRQVQPVFCLMRSSVLPHLTAFLETGGRKVDAWYKTLRVVEVDFEDDSAFRNINTRAELEACESDDKTH